MPRPRRASGFEAPGWPAPDAARRQLTRDQVVRTALGVLNDAGFDGLTMRRLADALGIKAASLYNHVKDKQELLTLMADVISADIPDLNPKRPWRRELETLAANVRRTLVSRRDAARVLAATFPIGPNRLRQIEQILAALRGAGFPRAAAADIAYILNSYVVGFVLDETSAGPVEGAIAKRLREMGRKWFKSLPPEQYPTIVALADDLVDPPSDRRFMLGLRALLDGFEPRRQPSLITNRTKG